MPQVAHYDIVDLLGEGGMAVVYRAVDARDGVEVALKILNAKLGGDAAHRDMLREEVRAAARLRHSNVVRVLDLGRVPHHLELTGGHVVGAGQDYMVMELVDGPSLEERKALRWLEIKSLLLQVLGALANAHAHGVIHRDLKPANILLADDGRTLTPKVTDFGIARIDIEQIDTGRGEAFAGTPDYVAPEQIVGTPRDQGPWTDLYAVGCLAWELVTGEPPFRSEHWLQTLRKHTHQPLPALPADVQVPAGFEGWLRRLLAKDTRERFRRAADAAYALVRLSPMPDNPFPRPFEIALPEGHSTIKLDLTAQNSPVTSPDEPSAIDDTMEFCAASPLAPIVAPPFPASFDLDEPVASDDELNAGLGLFHMRPTPLVGRQSIQNKLWATLAQVSRTEQSACVVLRGPSGTGKSRLARWLVARAEELGVADGWKAIHGQQEAPRLGLGGMVARQFRCFGQTRDEAAQRLDDWLEVSEHRERNQPDVQALLDLMAVDRQSDTRNSAPSSPAQQRSALRRLVATACAERTCILWLDDLQWGLEGISFALELLERDDVPVLVVATVQEEALADSARAREALAQLEAHGRTRRLDVDPLTRRAQLEMLERMAQLSPQDARALAERTGGNPMFAVQLVGDCVDRGILRPTRQGFVLVEGARPELAGDVYEALRRRVARALDTLAADSRRAGWLALELAAALGLEVDVGEWSRVCELARVSVPEGLMDALASARLIDQSRGAFSFIHAMLRETLLRRARSQGRYRAAHRFCARAFVDDGPGTRWSMRRRRAHHLIEAEQYEEALETLLALAKNQLDLADGGRARESLELFVRTAAHIELDRKSPLVADAVISMAHSLVNTSEYLVARSFARVGAHLARELADPALEARAIAVQAQWELFSGNLDEGLVNIERAIEVQTEAGADVLRYHPFAMAGYMLVFAGRLDEAIDCARKAVSLARASGQRWQLGRALEYGAWTLLEAGHLDQGRAWGEQVLQIAEEIGQPFLASGARALLAECARRAGRHDELVRWVEQVRAEAHESHGVALAVLDMRVGLSRLEQQTGEPAKRLLEGVIDVLPEGLVELAYARAGLIVDALRRDPDADVAAHLSAMEPVRQTGKVVLELARLLEWAAGEASARDRSDVARTLLVDAREQRRGLGDLDAVRRIDEQLGLLDSGS
ncbi:hypothetical protein FIV42_15845 [Persicimonas caeni]|uniref:Protein kinase domain-containing protein n=1 Tax=Persicimonas caeni TaxID=2292766 RepID=A0A4Y6PUZ4_PERCE|nr:serine/threonine-protein kinase [Persicimonas caeni]QDG52161.1 hypothetical protein FIV42_15845 [Persicimonas caeni]QED33383.1 protein kinase [Persicimonas caeni]